MLTAPKTGSCSPLPVSESSFMRRLVFLYLATFLFVILCGCNAHREAAVARDACSLIAKEEIESVQGSRVNDTKSSVRSEDLFHVSQCFYTTAESSKSVNLALVQERQDQKNKRTPKDFWKQKFGRYANNQEPDRKTEKKSGEEEKRANVKKIVDLGDDAYWVSNRFGGILYVLKGNAFISIGLGGTDDEETKLKKSKELAQKALQRL
jgi:hypothetical protein